MQAPVVRAEIGNGLILRNAAGEVVVDTARGIGTLPSWDELEALLPAALVQQLSGDFVPLDRERLRAELGSLSRRCLPENEA